MTAVRASPASCAWFFLGLAVALSASAADLPVVKVEQVRDEFAGGSFTRCSVGVIDGKKVFLKSNRGSPRGSRYANFESDMLAQSLFEAVGIRVPECNMVRLAEGSPLRKLLGSPVLAMEFVSTRFAGGSVAPGYWPGAGHANVDQFIDLLLLDVMMGNADRRHANFFVTQRYGTGEAGLIRPVPIDNNSGFNTLVSASTPTWQVNFLQTYDGLGSEPFFRELGTIANIVTDAPCHWALLGEEELRDRIRERAGDLIERLSDDVVVSLVEDLPREVLPHGTSVGPDEAWIAKVPAEVRRVLAPWPGKLSGAELFAWRKRELVATFGWRRDHLPGALERYWAWRAVDPGQRQLDAWRREDARKRAPVSPRGGKGNSGMAGD